MPVHNADIARTFEQIAEILEIENADAFRIRAYHNASDITINGAQDTPGVD